MKVRVEVVSLNAEGEQQRRQILTIERRELTMETHEQGSFEVIAGKSVVAFRRDDEDEVPSAKCFGYVQSYDEKPRQGKCAADSAIPGDT
jgi:hypothetical protein